MSSKNHQAHDYKHDLDLLIISHWFHVSYSTRSGCLWVQREIEKSIRITHVYFRTRGVPNWVIVIIPSSTIISRKLGFPRHVGARWQWMPSNDALRSHHLKEIRKRGLWNFELIFSSFNPRCGLEKILWRSHNCMAMYEAWISLPTQGLWHLCTLIRRGWRGSNKSWKGVPYKVHNIIKKVLVRCSLSKERNLWIIFVF